MSFNYKQFSKNDKIIVNTKIINNAFKIKKYNFSYEIL
jgi:hypothetical protein